MAVLQGPFLGTKLGLALRAVAVNPHFAALPGLPVVGGSPAQSSVSSSAITGTADGGSDSSTPMWAT
jgi:hypothetical protein